MQIEKRVSEIFMKYTGINFENNDTLCKESLFGEKLEIMPRNLVEVYMEIKKEFNIGFDERDFLNRKLKTYDDFKNTVTKITDIQKIGKE